MEDRIAKLERRVERHGYLLLLGVSFMFGVIVSLFLPIVMHP